MAHKAVELEIEGTNAFATIEDVGTALWVAHDRKTSEQVDELRRLSIRCAFLMGHTRESG